jgi:transposase
MSSDTRTREYVARQTAAGRTKKEIIRLLKRAVAREMFRCLTTTVTVPGIADLRPLRQSKNITLTAAAQHFGVWPATSPPSNAESVETTTSPTPTATGSKPLDEQ